MKLKYRPFDIVMDALSAAAQLGTSVFLALRWGQLPDRIPAHYDLNGQVDRWGGKSGLLVPLIFSWVFFILVTVLECFPKLWNTGVTVNAKNRDRVYSTLLHLLTSLKFLLTAFFSALTLLGTAFQTDMPIWFIVTFLALAAADLIFWLVRLAKSK